ncbi:MAG: hypothetical protein ABGW87_09000 [Sphingomonadaceae bacterium]
MTAGYCFPMLKGSAFLLILALAGCSSGRPASCEVAQQQIYACMDKHLDQGFSAFFDACIPHTKPIVIQGTWARDFEFNRFYENVRVQPQNAFQQADQITELVSDQPLQKDAAGRTLATLDFIKFVGRKQTCDVLPEMNLTQIVVDRVISNDVYSKTSSHYH